MDQVDKKVLVLGMGRTGNAVKSFLEGRGAIVKEYDDQASDREEDLLCQGYDYAVISPGIPLSHRAVVRLRENGVPILSELDLAYINCESKHVFAISGTNGKTTACTILHRMLSSVGRSHLVGNVGVPFIGEVDSIAKKDSVVVEISSFQIEQSHFFRPQIAALTNVGEDHLDRHGTKENYQSIKLSLLKSALIKVVNADDPIRYPVREVIRYSFIDQTADYLFRDHAIFCHGKNFRLPTVERGAAFDADYLCAFAVASTYCGAQKSFLSVYESAEVPPYRFQIVGKLCGATVINDSKGTNIDATLFALSRVIGRVAVILGGSDKGEDYTRLMCALEDKAERIYLIGANAGEMYLAAEGSVREKCLPMSDLESCVSDFCRRPLDVFLFSPASASFDSYRNYEERGRHFDELIAKYAKSY